MDEKKEDVKSESTDTPAPSPPSQTNLTYELDATHKGPLGLDIGTANIVVAKNNGKNDSTFIQLNAFYPIPYSRMTEKTLMKEGSLFFRKEEILFVLGYSAEKFANIFGDNTRRPIEDGLLNPKEEDGINIIKAIINKLIPKSARRNQRICFSVPGEPLTSQGSVVFHASVIRMHLKNLGYAPESINEGLAVVLSELAGTNYTGIGISMGGGMCNICFSYLSVPVITYSIRKGGDYIDAMVGRSVGEPPTKIKVIKEDELNLSIEPRNRIEIGLNVYYEDLFSTLVQSMHQAFGTSDRIPKLSKPIPIVLSGGTVLPKGSREKFKKALDKIRFPMKISDIMVAKRPLLATANGALVMAMT